MNFVIADTFAASFAKLTGNEQKATKAAVFDLQLNPAKPGIAFHRLERDRGRKFWSARVNDDLRLIVHRSDGTLLLCFVGCHDSAYAWARRRSGQHRRMEMAPWVEEDGGAIQCHSTTTADGEAEEPPKPLLFDQTDEEELLRFGVPKERMVEVRLATEDSFLEIVDGLPGDAAEALLDLATGVTPRPFTQVAAGAKTTSDLSARGRFRVIRDVADLAQALEYPWEEWAALLGPMGQGPVEHENSDTARFAGSSDFAGTVAAGVRGSYQGLQEWLGAQDGEFLQCSFAEVESVLGRPLPASARRHRPWWVNHGGNSQAKGWLAAGWAVEAVNMAGEIVVFRRAAAVR